MGNPTVHGKVHSVGERDQPEKWPADIVEYDGVELLLKPGVIEAELKSPGLKALGVLVDANTDPVGRWNRIRGTSDRMPMIPPDLPTDGLVMQNDEGLRFGVWLMPNCASKGMLETFLALFIDNPTTGLWAFVEAHCKQAKTTHQAPYSLAHLDKALIHAWLALQDPPGQQLHRRDYPKHLEAEFTPSGVVREVVPQLVSGLKIADPTASVPAPPP